MRTITLKLPESLLAEITTEAKARNVSKSQVVRERLANGRIDPAKGSLWSRMEDLLIKSDSLAPNLSSNKDRLKGYGKNRADR